jgi:hypothetical protein
MRWPVRVPFDAPRSPHRFNRAMTVTLGPVSYFAMTRYASLSEASSWLCCVGGGVRTLIW